jgi:NAD(P)H-flavin reductase
MFFLDACDSRSEKVASRAMSSAATSHLARVVGNRSAGGEMKLVALDVPDVVRASYTRPGQYVHVALRGETGYFALGNRAGREGTAPWEILLRRGGGVADLLFDASDGLEVNVSIALGPGFPVDSARGESALVVVTAGAFAAARATIAHRIADGDASKTSLLVGARTIESVPLQDEIDAMSARGVDVRIVLSRTTAPHIAEGARYVHHVLSKEHARAWIFIAGADTMIADVRAAASALGAPTERVLSNV